jgi:hypothetical protein
MKGKIMMEMNICVCFYLLFFCFLFHMVLILFSNYYKCNIGAYMDFGIHFCYWCLFFDFKIFLLL